jgi:hypothetical protein
MTQQTWLGLTRPSASTRYSVARVIDGRVRPGHDGGCGGGAVVTLVGTAIRGGARP